jgi:hypothetical protein
MHFFRYPTDKSWPAFKPLLATGPHRALFANFKPSTKDFRMSWRELRPEASELELHLLSGLLSLDPQQRFSADQARDHKWFQVFCARHTTRSHFSFVLLCLFDDCLLQEAPWPDHINLPHLKQVAHVTSHAMRCPPTVTSSCCGVMLVWGGNCSRCLRVMTTGEPRASNQGTSKANGR